MQTGCVGTYVLVRVSPRVGGACAPVYVTAHLRISSCPLFLLVSHSAVWVGAGWEQGESSFDVGS